MKRKLMLMLLSLSVALATSSAGAAELLFTGRAGLIRCKLDTAALGLAVGNSILLNKRAVRSSSPSQIIEASWVSFDHEFRHAFESPEVLDCPLRPSEDAVELDQARKAAGKDWIPRDPSYELENDSRYGKSCPAGMDPVIFAEKQMGNGPSPVCRPQPDPFRFVRLNDVLTRFAKFQLTELRF